MTMAQCRGNHLIMEIELYLLLNVRLLFVNVVMSLIILDYSMLMKAMRYYNYY
jgi:hypothetical protein